MHDYRSNNRYRMAGSTLLEYLIIASVFAGIFFLVLPGVTEDLETHHDNYSDTLSLPH